MKKLRIFALLTTALHAGGCATTGSSTAPKAQWESVNPPMVVYRIPANLAADISTLNLKQFNKGEKAKQEQLRWDQSGAQLTVERRTHNGIAGSGVVYRIQVSHKDVGGITELQLQPMQKRAYQQGTFLPFAVPTFDVHDFLSAARVSYKLELNSDFPPGAVKANFDRLLPKKQPTAQDMQQLVLARLSGKTVQLDDRYQLTLKGAAADIEVETYPYRSGSKAVIVATVRTQPNAEHLIDLAALFAQIEAKMQQIIDA
ncbi:MAG: hypothetical protein ACWA44_09390 [Thiotrichales bacterium]